MDKEKDQNSFTVPPEMVRDQKLTMEQIKALREIVLDKGLADLNPATVIDLKQFLVDQEPFATARAREKEFLDRKRESVRERRVVGRRRFFSFVKKTIITGLIASPFAGGGFGAFKLIEQYNSPENVAAREKADREKREKFETNNVLGLEFSVSSYYNWRVRHVENDPRVAWVESDEKDSIKNIGSNISISFGSSSTYILLESYQKLNGNPATKIKINHRAGGYEEWLLRDEPDPRINHSIVQFENTDDRQKPVFTTIKRSNNLSANSFDVIIMKKQG